MESEQPATPLGRQLIAFYPLGFGDFFVFVIIVVVVVVVAAECGFFVS